MAKVKPTKKEIKKVEFSLLDDNKIIINKNNIPKEGIYLLIKPLANKLYVGESTNIIRRLKQHIRAQYSDDLVCNKHLCNSIRKYGINNFIIYVIHEESDETNRIYLENVFIETFRNELGKDMVYNIREKSDSNFGTNTGDSHHLSIKSDVIKKVIEDYKTKKHLIKDLSKKYDIGVSTLSKIVGGSNKTVLKKHISGSNNNSFKMSDEDVIAVLEGFSMIEKGLNFYMRNTMYLE